MMSFSQSLQDNVTALVNEGKSILATFPQNGALSASAYDTGWISRIPTADNTPMFPQALTWIEQNQLEDGSWGDNTHYDVCDRLLSTLSCLVALQIWSKSNEKISLGCQYIQETVNQVNKKNYTFGFLPLFSRLIQDAKVLNLPLDYQHLQIQYLCRDGVQQTNHILKTYDLTSPSLFWRLLEGLPSHTLQMDSWSMNLGVANSPSSTACLYLETKDEMLLTCLQSYMSTRAIASSYFDAELKPVIYCLYMILFLGIEEFFLPEIATFVPLVKQKWDEYETKGIPVDISISEICLMLYILRQQGMSVSADLLHNYYEGGQWFAYKFVPLTKFHAINILNLEMVSLGSPIEIRLFEISRKLLSTPFILTGHIGLYGSSLDDYVQALLKRHNNLKAPLIEQIENSAIYLSTFLPACFVEKTFFHYKNLFSPVWYNLAQARKQILINKFDQELIELRAWTKRYLADVNQIRVLSVFFTSYNAWFGLDEGHIRLFFSKIALWIFAFDDYPDSVDFSVDKLEKLEQIFCEKEMHQIWLYPDTKHRLAILKLWESLENLIKDASVNHKKVNRSRERLYHILEENIRQHSKEYQQKETNIESSLTFEQYMETAIVTVGMGLATDFTLCYEGVPFKILQSAEYTELLLLAGWITRLSNDVASHERELGEGKVNGVGILMKEKGIELETAVSLLTTYFHEKSDELRCKVFTSNSVPNQHKKAVYNICRTTAWFYQAGNDYHQFTSDILQFHSKKVKVQFYLAVGRQIIKKGYERLSK